MKPNPADAEAEREGPGGPPKRLRVLHLEDNAADSALVQRALERDGFEVTLERVDTEAEFVERLGAGYDVVLCDDALPGYSAGQAIRFARLTDVPFIIVSGVIREEAAVAALKRGVADYILKDRIARLGPAVRQALRERDLRRAKRRADQARHQTESMSRAVLDSLPQSIAVLDADGAIAAVNASWRRFARANGLSSLDGAGVGADYLGVCERAAAGGDELAARALAGIRDVLDGRRPSFSMECPCHGPNEERWFVMTATPFEGGSGAVVSHESITERKRYREAVEQSERRHRALFDQSLDAILLADDDARYVSVNGAACAMLGYTAEELCARAVWDLTPGSLDAAGRALWSEFLAEGRQAGEYVVARKDGTLLDVEYRAVANIVPGLHLSILRDVTERRRTERELVRAKEAAEEMARLKSAFLANMSHEIRTPLTAIIGFAEELAEDADGEVADSAHRIAAGGRRLLDTLNSVLDLAQLEAGRLDIRIAPTDLGAVTADSVELFQHMAADRGLGFEVDLPETPVVVAASASALGRVLSNLLSNAVKYTERGAIAVSVRQTKSWGEVRVRDTGVGMDVAFLPHAFDEFRQESDGHGRTYDGNGLGLAIVKRLVSAMGGTITVESRRGEGSTFTVRLPRVLGVEGV